MAREAAKAAAAEPQRPAPAASSAGRPWHGLSAADVLAALDADGKGLSGAEAEARLREHGPNSLTPPRQRTALHRLRAQLDNLFVLLLLGAGLVTALLGEWLDSGVILGVVVIIAVTGFVQEGRAEQALAAVRGMLSPTALALRDGERRELPAEELVPGDVALLEAGDRVPADLRLLEARGLQVQEAALTGESTAVEKRPDAVDADSELADRRSMLYSGTFVAAGQAKGVVVATGDATEIGRISGLLARVETLKTPLMQRLDAVARSLSFAILAIAGLTFAIGVLLWGRGAPEMFFAAVSIAVAAIPEGLPAIMTITLAVGVQRMAKRHAIIRRLPAVETLGALTVICSDKTGTLTRNEMTATTIAFAGGELAVTGVGYEPTGGFRSEGEEASLDEHPLARALVHAGLLCNDARLRHEDDGWRMQGDPTEGALVVLAHKAGLDPAAEHAAWPRDDAIPFDSARRYMATLHHDHEGRRVVLVKGAPERVLEMCGREARADGPAPLDREAWRARGEAIAAGGRRVLAIARREAGSQERELEAAAVEQGLTLLGVVGLIDPPRDEAIRAVAACQEAGIRVKMITGDHALTARAVAERLGLANHDRVVTGRELDAGEDEDLRRLARDVDVFARTSPEHKLRLVEALQAHGQVTAMTGDGVNDAPALKRADVGIAMGKKGTEAAKEAAAMVLADDNFASIANAVEEGRTVYDNLKKAILFILPTNGGQALVVIGAILFGQELPVTPVQILWVNMVTAVTLGLAFAFEPREPGLMRRPPRPPDEPLLTPFHLWRIGFVALLLTAGTHALFLLEQLRGSDLETARTVAVNTLVMGQIFYLLSARFLHEPVLSRDGLLGSRAVLVAIGVCLLLQLAFTHAPPLHLLFGTAGLDAAAWARCVLAGLSVFALVEAEKVAVRRRLPSDAAAA